MNTLQEMLNSAIADSDYEEYSGDPQAAVLSCVDSIADSILVRLKQNAPSMLKQKWRDQCQFEKRLKKSWERPLDLLDLFISIATEAGSHFNHEFQPVAARSGDSLFEALTIMHARACQVSSAILVLLRSGYADDADARWRTLHEISVMGYFISKHGQELAEKYLLHDTIQRYKLACQHQKYKERINEEPITKDEFDSLKSERDQLVNRFGKSFKEEYGWAASEIRKDYPSISDIEDQVGLEHMRPYYRMASDNVHANSHGSYSRIGLSQSLHDDGVILAGASNLGLVDPGHSTAISLNQVISKLSLVSIT